MLGEIMITGNKKLRILAFSDAHRTTFDDIDVAGIDLAIFAGDFMCQDWRTIDDSHFIKWCKANPNLPVWFIPGNHDYFDSSHPNENLPGNVTRIDDGQIHDFRGVKIYGAMCCEEGAHQKTCSQKVLAQINGIPAGIDILVVHEPPMLDDKTVSYSDMKHSLFGKNDVTDKIKAVVPGLVICGHVHENLVREGKIGETKVVNVSRVRFRRTAHHPVYSPWIIEVSDDGAGKLKFDVSSTRMAIDFLGDVRDRLRPLAKSINRHINNLDAQKIPVDILDKDIRARLEALRDSEPMARDYLARIAEIDAVAAGRSVTQIGHVN